MKSIHMACDHAGIELKETLRAHLEKMGYTVTDHGTYSKESCDYPVFAHALCNAVEAEDVPGILICGTGIGMSIAANRHKGIRAALCGDVYSAKYTRLHNDANILAMGHGTACPLHPPAQQCQRAVPGGPGHGRGAGACHRRYLPVHRIRRRPPSAPHRPPQRLVCGTCHAAVQYPYP